ncbi:ABC transporter permease [Streptomyces jietaisiensis]|uniref:ABC transporter permease n=1 Tax=Streptomyces griseoaurantiacus TaxID=68213 RepID=A0ABZ1V193_9ACTN|nr:MULTISPECIES: ABC transporter permease [Streptomyces]MDX3091018.1 ABC transporter permease [Streptomyces sp. ME12-02E]MDX3334464.1 ABC transporter permease [Streptomyces sp. ME02-6978a]
MSARTWARDLSLGARFAVTGGREGWVRTVLTAVGVGLGVALLLLTTALPSVIGKRHDRDDARTDFTFSSRKDIPRGEDTLVSAHVDTSYHDEEVRGRLLQPEGPEAPVPPGLRSLPKQGEMYVSPGLKKLLASKDGALLRERLPYRTAGTIGDSGLMGPRELAYYAYSDDIARHVGSDSRVARIKQYGDVGEAQDDEGLPPVLLLLILVIFVVLLMPVAVFIAAAVRFGGERRDRRLAALRLVGSDGGMTRRIAAGEALAGSVLGLVFGTGFFLLGRELVGSVDLFGISVFPSYLTPSPLLALLVALAVPAAAVLVTLFALRGVVIEPLGVVRTARPARRRLWWRLLLPVAGLAMLSPMIGKGNENGDFNGYLVVGGVLLLLVGVTALLPWIVETVVGRLDSGGVAWQLAVRRLQLSSGTAARMVNGIAVAVAGAIALQMLFTGVQDDFTQDTGRDPSRAQMEVDMTAPGKADLVAGKVEERFQRTKGVAAAVALSVDSVSERRKDPELSSDITVGTCASLREIADLPSCHDGDAFALPAPSDPGQGPGDEVDQLLKPGLQLYVDPSFSGSPKGAEVAWKVPDRLPVVKQRHDALQNEIWGLLVTPSAAPAAALPQMSGRVYVRLDHAVPDATEHVRNTAAALDPFSDAWTWVSEKTSDQYEAIRTGLFIGATCVLALIGASLLVSQLEQLRERKRLLSALVAFGTRRRTLSLSVLWQSAIPIALGLVLASVVGLTLGAVLQKMSQVPVQIYWGSVLSMTGVGAAVVLTVTVLSLPALLRLMRPEGLRTE